MLESNSVSPSEQEFSEWMKYLMFLIKAISTKKAMTDGFITSGPEKLSVQEMFKQYIFLKWGVMKHTYNCLESYICTNYVFEVILNNCF